MNTIIKSYQLKNRETRYMFRIDYGINPATGKFHRTTRRSFKSKQEAEHALKIELENKTNEKRGIVTYQDVYSQWINLFKEQDDKGKFEKINRFFNYDILPAMGQYNIKEINHSICQSHVNEWNNKLKHHAKVIAFASIVMDFAVKQKYVTTNPFKLVKKTRSRKKYILNIIHANK